MTDTTPRPAALDGLLGYVEGHLDPAEGRQSSRFSATPKDIDAFLRQEFTEGTLLKFYQWVGRVAVSEAIGDVRRSVGEDPVPPENRYYSQDSVYVFLDGPEEGGPYPTKLPVGRSGSPE